jgi:hypothetical protein
MNIKISTQEQLDQIRIGHIIRRFPRTGTPEQAFDESRITETDIFTIRSVNKSNNVMELVMTESAAVLFASPGDIGRLFIKSSDLLLQSRWWLS